MSELRELVVTLPRRRRVDVTVGAHVLHTDQPVTNGGDDTAPSPFEIFLASLGACAGIFVQGFCAARRIPYEDIRIFERPDYDDRGALRAVALEISLPGGFPEQYRDALVRAVEGCSVKRAIAMQPEITAHTVVHLAAVGAAAP
jgi:putative redox protein